MGCRRPRHSLGNAICSEREKHAQGLGYTSKRRLNLAWAVRFNHGPGFYNFEKTDFSPRVSIAYSPRPDGGLLRKIFGENDKTVIRAGFSRVYDRAASRC